MSQKNRREFLGNVGSGVLAATLGPGLAMELGLSSRATAAEADDARLVFGPMEPLVRFMQETPIDKLQPGLVKKLAEGETIDRLTAAAVLANARTFGGEDYVGFHTIMALGPALHMSREMPAGQAALPILKVLYRNTNRIQEKGGGASEVLKPVMPAATSQDKSVAEEIRKTVHEKKATDAEALLAGLGSPEAMFEALLHTVEEDQEVHRTVLPYRAWELLPVVGREHAHTLLRQSLRYCVNAESWRRPEWNKPGEVLTKLMEEHKLMDRKGEKRPAEDAWVENLCNTIFSSTPEQAAAAVAAALAEGFDPSAIGEALTLATNQLLLRDAGRPPAQEVPGKPIGSVHGDSIGVHACDSSNAWRNMARVTQTRNSAACLILGAWQAAEDRVNRGGDFLKWQPLPLKYHLDGVKATDEATLAKELEAAVRGNLQARACAIAHRCGELGLSERPVLDVLLKYAVSEDGALHAEKFYRTVCEEFQSTRPKFRWRHIAALARVTASEYGKPAPGQAEARDLLRLA